eukprot:TRINITY_DN18880_c0_g1_i1.p1 TRINITY_DN18880_c0_g1~~TRINITY_DN18880_c0_g1_i1.p1  ORF type:complete len:117 (+),score=26.08 TRINITY_DN18880_c0_g1_i1:74-424(+)
MRIQSFLFQNKKRKNIIHRINTLFPSPHVPKEKVHKQYSIPKQNFELQKKLCTDGKSESFESIEKRNKIAITNNTLKKKGFEFRMPVFLESAFNWKANGEGKALKEKKKWREKEGN